jgi:hypothetical protein
MNATDSTRGCDVRLDFGKYKGRRLADVPDDYLRWLLDEATNLTPSLRRAVRECLRNGDDGDQDAADLDDLRDELLAGVDRVRRNLAAKFHPDRGGSTAAMAAVNTAADDFEMSIRETFARVCP